jgi:hypothetical protein
MHPSLTLLAYAKAIAAAGEGTIAGECMLKLAGELEWAAWL